MKKIFLLILLLIVVFLGAINVNANYTYENNNYTDYRYVEYYNYDDGCGQQFIFEQIDVVF